MSSTQAGAEAAVLDSRSTWALKIIKELENPPSVNGKYFRTFTEIARAQRDVELWIAKVPVIEGTPKPFPEILRTAVKHFVGDDVLDDLEDALGMFRDRSETEPLAQSILVSTMKAIHEQTPIPKDVLTAVHQSAAISISAFLRDNGMALIDQHLSDFDSLLREVVTELLNHPAVPDALDLQSDFPLNGDTAASRAKASGAIDRIESGINARDARWHQLLGELSISYMHEARLSAIQQFEDLAIAKFDLTDAWRKHIPGLMIYTPEGVSECVDRLEAWSTDTSLTPEVTRDAVESFALCG